MNRYLFLLFLLSFGTSCTTVSDEPAYDFTPRIELLGLTPDTVREFRDSVFFKVYYEDGDGDLGFSNFDSNSVYIRDLRFTRFDEFYLGPITPESINESINGEIDFVLPGLFVLGNSDQERTSFELMIKDRAGNFSNLVSTDEVLIIKN